MMMAAVLDEYSASSMIVPNFSSVGSLRQPIPSERKGCRPSRASDIMLAPYYLLR